MGGGRRRGQGQVCRGMGQDQVSPLTSRAKIRWLPSRHRLTNALSGAGLYYRTTAPSPLAPHTPLPTTPIKPFDWTYSSLHTGVVSLATSSAPPSWRKALPTEIIPLALLSQPDPILFYDEIPLFESELDDNGTSLLNVRVVSRPVSTLSYITSGDDRQLTYSHIVLVVLKSA
jgi:hypothetical protein